MVEKELEAKVEAMEKELQRLKDIEAIRKLENAYGYYLINFMNQELIDCFTERGDATLEWPEGTFLGKDGVRQFFGNINKERNLEFMHQMMQISGIIDVAPDGKTAKGRWWGFGAMAIPMGDAGINQALACGVYENEFIKEDGVWKLWKIKWVPQYSAPLDKGWVRPERVAKPRPPREGEMRVPDWWKPDLPPKGIPYAYPSGYILPFHFRHPVTGKETTEEVQNARVKGVKSG